MSSTKYFNTRVQNKIDLETNWKKATFTPLPGEFIIYAPDSTYAHSRIKVGDGKKTINDLPFLSYSAYDIAIAGGWFKGTEEEWIESLHGVDVSDVIFEQTTEQGAETKITILLSDGSSKTFSVFNGNGIENIVKNISSSANGGKNEFTINLSNGDSEVFSIYNGHGIDTVNIAQSNLYGGESTLDIELSDGQAKHLSIYNGHGINKFEKKEVSTGNGGQTTLDIELSTGQKETFNIYNGEGIDEFKIIKESNINGGENQIQFKLSNKTDVDTLSIYNGEGIDEFKITKQSTSNGGENQFTIKMSNDPEIKTFSVFNGEKGDTGTGISSVKATPFLDGNGGTNVTISLDDGSEPTNFSIRNGEVTDVQLNAVIANITADLQLRSRSYTFDTVDEMKNKLQNYTTEQLNELHLGDVFLIRDIGVPDYWWEPLANNVTTISEYMDKDIIIEGKGACRILETSKLNLSGYCGLDHKKSESDTLSGIKDLSNYKIRIAEDGDEGVSGYITLIIPKEG